MSCEICVRCGILTTPWEMRKELGGHVCYDCHCELSEKRKDRREKMVGTYHKEFVDAYYGSLINSYDEGYHQGYKDALKSLEDKTEIK